VKILCLLLLEALTDYLNREIVNQLTGETSCLIFYIGNKVSK